MCKRMAGKMLDDQGARSGEAEKRNEGGGHWAGAWWPSVAMETKSELDTYSS